MKTYLSGIYKYYSYSNGKVYSISYTQHSSIFRSISQSLNKVDILGSQLVSYSGSRNGDK